MAKVGLSLVRDTTGELLKNVKKLKERSVLVGVPGDHSDRGEAITNAALAYIHNEGCAAANIPARPFMEPGIARVRAENENSFRKIAVAAAEGRESGMENGFTAIGLRTAASIKQAMTEGIPPPLKAATIRARQRRGHTGTTPLIDRGKLLQSINFVVRG